MGSAKHSQVSSLYSYMYFDNGIMGKNGLPINVKCCEIHPGAQITKFRSLEQKTVYTNCTGKKLEADCLYYSPKVWTEYFQMFRSKLFIVFSKSLNWILPNVFMKLQNTIYIDKTNKSAYFLCVCPPPGCWRFPLCCCRPRSRPSTLRPEPPSLLSLPWASAFRPPFPDEPDALPLAWPQETYWAKQGVLGRTWVLSPFLFLDFQQSVDVSNKLFQDHSTFCQIEYAKCWCNYLKYEYTTSFLSSPKWYLAL